MPKIDKVDLYECLYYATEEALTKSQLETLAQQEQNTKLMELFIQERRARLLRNANEMQNKLAELGDRLEQKYGVEQEQINWETGEYNEVPKATTEASEPSGAGIESDEGVDAATGGWGTDGSAPAGSSGAETPDRRRAEDPGSTVD